MLLMKILEKSRGGGGGGGGVDGVSLKFTASNRTVHRKTNTPDLKTML